MRLGIEFKLNRRRSVFFYNKANEVEISLSAEILYIEMSRLERCGNLMMINELFPLPQRQDGRSIIESLGIAGVTKQKKKI